MTKFEFSFQYIEEDFEVIRQATNQSEMPFSAKMTAWVCGVLLGAVFLAFQEMWNLLVLFLPSSLGFGLFWAARRRSIKPSIAERTSRKVSFYDDCFSEMVGQSKFEKSWAAVDSVEVTAHHLLLRTPQSLLAIPQRAVGEDKWDQFITFVRGCKSNEGVKDLSDFRPLFDGPGHYPSHRFRWQEADLAKLQMAVFHPYSSVGIDKPKTINWLIAVAVLVWMVIGFSFFWAGKIYHSAPNWASLLNFFIANALPFAVTGVGLLFMEKRDPDKPHFDEEVFTRLSDNGLLVGHRHSISHFCWGDISGFFHSDDFIGFQFQNSVIHVVCSRAFGEKNEAMEFLKQADQLRTQSLGFVGQDNDGVDSTGTGNPFQAPRSFN